MSLVEILWLPDYAYSSLKYGIILSTNETNLQMICLLQINHCDYIIHSGIISEEVMDLLIQSGIRVVIDLLANYYR